jgi:hypothetical protein
VTGRLKRSTLKVIQIVEKKKIKKQEESDAKRTH